MKNSKNQFKNNEQYLIEDIIKNGKGSRTKTRLMICDDKSCETNFTISDTNYKKHYGE